MIESGSAYRCFCSRESLKMQREMTENQGGGFVYPGTCRQLPREESDEMAEDGEPFTVRFRVPEGQVVWHDLVHGKTRFANNVIDDFILLRSDATPTYLLSVVSDDIAMRITHVIRGDDHLSNTPQADPALRSPGRLVAGVCTPAIDPGPGQETSLQTICRRLGSRVSRPGDAGRRGDVQLPDVTGFGRRETTASNSTAETLVESFDLQNVGKSGAVFDLTKLEWLNGQTIDSLDADQFAAQVKPWLQQDGLWRDAFEKEKAEDYRRCLDLLKPRTRTLATVGEAGRWFLDPADPAEYDEKASRKHLKGEDLDQRLTTLKERLSALPTWDAETLEASLRELAEERELSAAEN